MDMLSQVRKSDELRFVFDACSELGCKKRAVLQNCAEPDRESFCLCVVSRRTFVSFCFWFCVLVCRRGEPQSVCLAVKVRTTSIQYFVSRTFNGAYSYN